MKKLTVLMIAVTLIFTFALFGFIPTNKAVLAEETTESGTVDNLPEESETAPQNEDNTPMPDGKDEVSPVKPDETTEEEEIVLTPEELKEIINTVLTENQQTLADKVATILAEKFHLNKDTVYLLLGIGFVVIALAVAFLIKFLVAKGRAREINTKLLATQSAYTDMSKEKEDLATALNGLSSEKIGELIRAALPEFVNVVSADVAKKLHMEGDTIGQMLGNDKMLLEQVQTLIKSLEAIALGNRDVAVKMLAEIPTEQAVQKLALENEKLRAELGEAAVKKVLSEQIAESEKNKAENA